MARCDDDDVLDERGLLRDGKTLTVGMLMRDHALEDASRHQPGSVRVSDEARAARELAYQLSKRELADAWKTPITSQCGPPQPERPSTADAPQRRAMSIEDARRVRDEAYAAYCRDLETAWKRPAP